MTASASTNDTSALLGTGAQQTSLALASQGVQRWVWESQFGVILIEVIDDVPFVNGARVERSAEHGHSL